MIRSSVDTLAWEDSVEGQGYKVRFLWVEEQRVKDVIKAVKAEHSLWVFRPLSHFLCLVYACLLCLAPLLYTLPMSMGTSTRTSFKMLSSKQRRNTWKRLKMNVVLGRSYFFSLRWERLVHHGLISNCMLSALVKLRARLGPCPHGVKAHQEQQILNK